MASFYVLNDVPPVEAATLEDAAKEYARQAGITAGAVLMAAGVKSFDVTVTPAEVSVQARP